MTVAEQPRLMRAMFERSGEEVPGPFASDSGQLFNFHTAMEMSRGFAGERPVVWMNVFFPSEMLYALDIIPISYEVMGGLTGSLGLLDVLDTADDAYPARDTCTFLRAGLGGGLEQLFPQPAALLCTSHLCEGAPKVAHALGDQREAPYLLLDVPERADAAGEAYLAHQLEAMAHELETLADRTLDMDRLAAAFEESNRAAAAMQRIQELRGRSPVPAFGSPMIGMRLYLPWGHPIGAQIMEARLAEVEAQLASDTPLVPGGEAHRIMWMHLRPFYETDLFEFMEIERRAMIVHNNFCQAYWEPLDASDPWRSLARKVLQNPDLLPAQEAADHYVREGLKYRVDGVVQFSHWGCRWNAGRNRILKDAFAAEDIPFMNVDGDGVDSRASSAGQLRTRIEGFLEILEARHE